MRISIVSPVYKAEKIIDELVSQIIKSVSLITLDFEIILIEDGSPDNSWNKIVENSKKYKVVKGISLSRNFGQHHAITAGLDHIKGDWIVVMDCDLQDNPKEIINLYNKALEGFDIVYAKRINRQDSLIKRLQSKVFYKVFKWLSGINQDDTIANFGIYSNKVIDSVNKMREPMRAFPPMLKWVGFRYSTIEVIHGVRYEGKTSYNWSKLLNLAIDIIISYSDKPLKLSIKIGFFLSFFSIFFIFHILYSYVTGTISQIGYSSLIISIWFLSGVLLFFLGIVGLYIGKAFEAIKQRPLYLISNKTNF